jgi:hypothetical protein
MQKFLKDRVPASHVQTKQYGMSTASTLHRTVLGLILLCLSLGDTVDWLQSSSRHTHSDMQSIRQMAGMYAR